MSKLYSQRNTAPPTKFTEEVPEKARQRILHGMQQQTRDLMYGILKQMFERLLLVYGTFGPSRSRSSGFPQRLMDHFLDCDTGKALNFIEMFFQTAGFRDYLQMENDENKLTRFINVVFLEEGVGYELTPVRWVQTDNGQNLQLPKIIRKSDQFQHEQVIKPALEILRDPRFKAANDELLEAHDHYRNGRERDTIWKCGCALETVLKTICRLKRWTYDPNKSNLADLVEICRDKGLFPPLYVESLKSVGTIRNKMGGHGIDPDPKYTVGRENVEHMLRLTSTQALFLIESAKL